MGVCKDPRLTYLNSIGFNVVKLPRADVEPLEVLGRDDKSLDNLGKLSTIWKSTGVAPVPGPPVPAANINGQKTDQLKLSIGLDILASILQGMGVPSPRVDAAYSNAQNVQFTFTNVNIIRVAPLEVGQYLAHGDLDQANPFASYFLDHSKEAYVITELLTSNAIIVKGTDDHGTSVGVDLPNIEKIVGVNVKVSPSASDASELTYQGPQTLVFGFKVYGVSYADGKWAIHGQEPSGGIAYMTAHEPKGVVLAPSQLMATIPKMNTQSQQKPAAA